MDSDYPAQEDIEQQFERKHFFDNDTETRIDYANSRYLHSSSPAEAVFGDSPRDRADDMGIEDACELNSAWDEEGSLIAPSDGNFPIPLPPPECSDTNEPSRSGTPNLNAEFDPLFNSEPNTDVFDNSSPGVCGLINLGNTCFMNSGLQCLFNTPPLIQYFLTHTQGKDALPPESLTTHFNSLIHKIWSGNYSKVKPTDFQLALANQHQQFKDYRQHDCQEFLALVLGTLHEFLNTASCKSHISDLSADPMTPRSVFEESAALPGDVVEADSSGQIALTSNRCEVSSSSSRSSESSIDASRFRMLPLPIDVKPFNSPIANPEAQPLLSEISIRGEEADVDIFEPDCNIIPDSALKRDPKLINVVTDLNNKLPCLSDIIQKDTKTSNVNVLVPEVAPNNKVIFDSDKFPKLEIARRKETCNSRNFTASYHFEEKTGSKRMMMNGDVDIGGQSEDSTNFDEMNSSLGYNDQNKRCKMETSDREKNELMEYARKAGFISKLNETEGESCEAAAVVNCVPSNLPELDDELEADKQWEKHTGLNQSVIVDSFQGQFKSTVVCSQCGFSSSTYEPFMYLSVPLPHAMEQQLTVTFVPASSAPPTKFLLTLNRQDKVLHIKQQLRALLSAPAAMALELAEVLDHHIARILDECQLLRCIANSERSIYAFEMTDDVTCSGVDPLFTCDIQPQPLDLTDQIALNNSDCHKGESDAKISKFMNNLQTNNGDFCGPLMESECDSQTINNETATGVKVCTICLDDSEKPMKRHIDCSCFLCEECLVMSLKHYKEQQEEEDGQSVMSCPVCNILISPDVDMVDANDSGENRLATRMLNVPVLFREDLIGETQCHQLFGHPHLLRLSNKISSIFLQRTVAKIVPDDIDSYSIILVDGQGYHCSRCLYTAGCRGCPLPETGELTLRSGDNLAVIVNNPALETSVIEHESIHDLRKQETLSIYDCLSAFCESERLDEHNPWYCPRCECNQIATKTLSVWRYPDYLIVYLKRFVFYEYTSVKLDNKVSFPLTDLKLPTNHPGVNLSFDLYACVNHIGGASAGHYTAYAKNPQFGVWHLFNDETVTPQKPQESDFSHAYILFYQLQKSGILPTCHMSELPSASQVSLEGEAELLPRNH